MRFGCCFIILDAAARNTDHTKKSFCECARTLRLCALALYSQQQKNMNRIVQRVIIPLNLCFGIIANNNNILGGKKKL